MNEVRQIDSVAVVGGGIIGLAIGWRLVRAGRSVTVFDRGEAGREASWVGAGMLAPHSEVGFEDEPLMRLGVESVRRFPSFLNDLAQDTATPVAFDNEGTLIVGFDRDDVERMRRLFDFRVQLGLPVQWLNASEAREREPLLSPRVSAAIWLPEDGQVNARVAVVALKEAFVARGGELREHTAVDKIETDDGRARGVVAGGSAQSFDAVVIAAGCWSNQIEGIADEVRPPVRPVKGQIVALRATEECALQNVVRAPDVYLMRKDDGRLLIGATQEEMGFDKQPTAGGVKMLLERGWEAVPSIYDLEIDSIDVGLRPGSRDNQPIVGESSVPGLFYATGHFRHGILLTPATADMLVEQMLEGKVDELIAPFAPSRFIRAEA